MTVKVAGAYTYYCFVHRDQAAVGSPPSHVSSNGCPIFQPACPVCHERMYYVPDGGTVIPEV